MKIREFTKRYANEIVGLSVMALMVVALVGGETEPHNRFAEIQPPAEVVKIQVGFPLRD